MKIFLDLTPIPAPIHSVHHDGGDGLQHCPTDSQVFSPGAVRRIRAKNKNERAKASARSDLRRNRKGRQTRPFRFSGLGP
jgi:hypothetical protein